MFEFNGAVNLSFVVVTAVSCINGTVSGFKNTHRFPFHEGLHWQRNAPSFSRHAPLWLHGFDAQGLMRSEHRFPRYPRGQTHRKPESSISSDNEQFPKTQGDRSQAVVKQNTPEIFIPKIVFVRNQYQL